ncbi:thioredoxin family protein [Geomesophilobacter sediminis]|uniref:Thioredoxin family protein n=1 Tax=Geomesophilobacter sediminis TaxID=2798584 RepID=A0A8J7LUJ3_9BACT|nr:thioredoxin family protein [Geomesophilobacter sediminis]MBJ6724724.1 thioredoxin family protein [Geomesophilobacter sediminis]
MISWESDMGKALAKGKAEQKSILVEFFSPECIGCKQMEEVTFPDLSVANFMIDKLVALKVPVASTALAGDFRVMWTPTLIMLDYYGREHFRSVGFVPPEDMVPLMLLGQAKVAFDAGQFNESVIQLNTLLNGNSQSIFAPEAVFLRGVSRFKESHQVQALKDAQIQLAREYPGTEWQKKAEPYRLL